LSAYTVFADCNLLDAIGQFEASFARLLKDLKADEPTR
jgi:hypothetical protein